MKQPRTTVEFLDAIKARHNIPSDYKLAKFIGVAQQTVSNYRVKGIGFDDELAIRVAELLEIDPGYVLACIHAERTKRPQVRDAWEKVARGLAASLAAVFIGTSVVPRAEATPLPSPTANNPTVYIMSKRRRRPKTGQPGRAAALTPALASLAALLGVPKDRTILA